jgi:hypothetical protein
MKASTLYVHLFLCLAWLAAGEEGNVYDDVCNMEGYKKFAISNKVSGTASACFTQALNDAMVNHPSCYDCGEADEADEEVDGVPLLNNKICDASCNAIWDTAKEGIECEADDCMVVPRTLRTLFFHPTILPPVAVLSLLSLIS